MAQTLYNQKEMEIIITDSFEDGFNASWEERGLPDGPERELARAKAVARNANYISQKAKEMILRLEKSKTKVKKIEKKLYLEQKK